MSPAKKGTPLVPYIRQSRSKEHTISLEEQWRAIEAWAKAANATLSVGSFKEADKAGLVERSTSGNKAWRERALGEAIARCQRGKASGIIVYDQSRLTREDLLGTAEVWAAIDDAKADLIDATGGGMVNRMMYVIKAEMNRQQWETARLRGEGARRNAIERGVHIGTTPLGYTRVNAGPSKGRLAVDPATAPAVRAAFEARADGASWTRVAEILTEGTGRPWSFKAAVQMLKSRTYLGEVHSGPFVKAGAHEPLVGLALFEKVQRRAIRRGPNQRRKPGLVSGFVFCGSCGHSMTQDWNMRRGERAEFYRCSNLGLCEHRAAVMHHVIEPYVGALVIDHYLGVFERVTAPDDLTPELEAAVLAAEEELTAYLIAVQATTPGFADGVKVREAAVIAAREALGAYTPTGEVPPKAVLVKLRELAEQDPQASADELRQLASRAIERVDVRPGRGPVADRVTVTWREEAEPLSLDRRAAA